tara:strand:+ start:10457 stop:11599 length:1143 start_codon:yes stop_codon:yes gene_type:complete
MDHYDLLKICKTSTNEEIKKAYKKLALIYHPDRGGDEVKFKEITTAYNILSDITKRKNYDLYGSINTDNLVNPFDMFEKMFQFSDDDIDEMLNTKFQEHPKIFIKIHKTPLNSFNTESVPNIFENMSNLFEDILGNSLNHQIPNNDKINSKKEECDNIEIEINIDDIINGNKKKIKFNINDICSCCNGTSAYDPNDLVLCLYCSGNNSSCRACSGKGNMFKTDRRCSKCKNGVIQRENSVNIQIPKGVPENHTMIIINKGSYNFESKIYNNVKLKFKYDLSKNIQIHGSAIFAYIDIKLEDILIGNINEKIKLGKQTLELTFEKYIDPTEVITYTGYGIPIYKKEKERGDLIIKFNITFPKNNNNNIDKYKLIFKKIFKN